MAFDIYLSAASFGQEGLEQAAVVARQVGCVGLEAPEAFLSATIIPRINAVLPICVLAINWRPDQPSNITASLALASRFGMRAVNIYCGLPASADAVSARRCFLADVTAALAATPNDSPLILLENELAPAPGFSAAFDVWTEIVRAVNSPRFRGTLDAANFVAAGDLGALARITSEAAPLIGHIHAKGVVPFDTRLFAREPFRRRWQAVGEWLAAPAGEGRPDWTELLGRLIAKGYQGAVTIEPFQQLAMIERAISAIRLAVSMNSAEKGQ